MRPRNFRVAGRDYHQDKTSYIPPHGERLLTIEEFIEIYGETRADLVDGRVVFPGVEYGLRKMGLVKKTEDGPIILASREDISGKGVNRTIRYCNTDLDLISKDDLTNLASAFAKLGVLALYVTHGENGLWHATFEVDGENQIAEAEANIGTMLTAIESLDASTRTIWNACTKRDFNIGYDCRGKSWAFNQGLSAEIIGRIAKSGASLSITLYPPERGKE